MKVKAIRVHEYGGPEKLVYEDIEIGEPGPGQALIRHTAVGLNFADLHNREGRYPLPSLPHVLGGEGAGVVEQVGPGVTDVRPGDRVAYAAGGPAFPPGSYAEARLFDASRLIVLPDEIDDKTAAGMIVKGLTAQYLLKSVYPVRAGHTVVVHAAAGGVGSFLTQWASYLGARVIGVVGSEEKAKTALANGCMHALILGQDDIPRRVRALTGGEGVPVVFDAVGQATFETSLDCLGVRGTLVSFGSASGKIPPFDPFVLNLKGSLSITSAAFAFFVRSRPELLSRAHDLIDVVLRGKVKVAVNQEFRLADARQAHEALESRKTQGASILIP
ncbi:quinone oxidoreductase [Puniceibacterium sp. IMCC21224]|uniref:quinone oxidoreductase family protein n=1 Tax=Puniceibacterium sp. IMCC21224 TaxID=1618204 RepID=UPI00064DFA8D|nr:quinone oxidoreductase [Puniceibacterium sp. IMCC21224]KMK64927.1 Zn-dependent oxidoreductase, NADPH:quinone reductase [Puniceibacterium sp. IMCC21224]